MLEQNQKVHGWFLFGKPALSINDVELLKQVQVKDFDHFVDRNESNTSRALGTGGKLDRVGRILHRSSCKYLSPCSVVGNPNGKCSGRPVERYPVHLHPYLHLRKDEGDAPISSGNNAKPHKRVPEKSQCWQRI